MVSIIFQLGAKEFLKASIGEVFVVKRDAAGP